MPASSSARPVRRPPVTIEASAIMDDRTSSQNPLDALADLFLTGLTPQPGGQPPQKPAPTRTQHVWPDGTENQDAPAPTRAAAAPPQPRSTNQRPRTPLNALLSDNDLPPRRSPLPRSDSGNLPLRRSNASTPTESAGPPTPRPFPISPAVNVEVVLLGNLPGFGGPWLTQYADELAQKRGGTTAVVRIDGDQVDVELVGRRPTPLKPPDQPQPPNQATFTDLARVLHEFSRSESLDIRSWLVQLPTPANTQTIQIASHIDHWTVLCGADDAAVVAAYRLAKQLVEGCHDLLLDSARCLGLMVLGSDEHASREAAQNLHKTIHHFLNLNVEFLGWRKQMQPVALHRVGSFWEDGKDPWMSVGSFFAQLVDPNRPTPPLHQELQDDDANPFAHTSSPKLPPPPLNLALPVHQDPTPSPTASVTSQEPPPPLAPAPEFVREPPSQGEIDEVAQPAFVHNPRPPQTRRTTTNTIALRDLLPPGTVLLKARCPRSPRTRLALDAQGGLHLFRLCMSQPPAPADTPNADTNLESAVVELLAVRSWTREYRGLLRLTPGGHNIDPATKPILHLYTDQAKPAIQLAQKLPRGIKLHLACAQQPANQTAWKSIDLS